MYRYMRKAATVCLREREREIETDRQGVKDEMQDLFSKLQRSVEI